MMDFAIKFLDIYILNEDSMMDVTTEILAIFKYMYIFMTSTLSFINDGDSCYKQGPSNFRIARFPWLMYC